MQTSDLSFVQPIRGLSRCSLMHYFTCTKQILEIRLRTISCVSLEYINEGIMDGTLRGFENWTKKKFLTKKVGSKILRDLPM